MPLKHLDILFVGMQKETYVAAVDAANAWHKSDASYAKTSITCFDVGYLSAASLAEKLPHLSVIFFANEGFLQQLAVQASCRKICEVLVSRAEKPMIVVCEDTLDLINEFEVRGYTVDLPAENGTVEGALKTIVVKAGPT